MRHSDHGNSDADLPGIENTLILPVAGALGWCAAVGVPHVYHPLMLVAHQATHS